jgi:hypothetical protein
MLLDPSSVTDDEPPASKVINISGLAGRAGTMLAHMGLITTDNVHLSIDSVKAGE